MKPIDLSRLSPTERKSYETGLAIVQRKLAAARAEKPTAQQIAQHHLAVGKAQVAARLAAPTIAAIAHKAASVAARAVAKELRKPITTTSKTMESGRITRHRIYNMAAFV